MKKILFLLFFFCLTTVLDLYSEEPTEESSRIKITQEKDVRTKETESKDPKHRTNQINLPPIMPQVGFDRPTMPPKTPQDEKGKEPESKADVKKKHKKKSLNNKRTLPPPKTLEPITSLPTVS